MTISIRKAALPLVIAAGVGATVFGFAEVGLTGDRAFDAATRPPSSPADPPVSNHQEPLPNPSVRLTGTTTPTGMLPFGLNPGDCPVEDDCVFVGADYRDGRWHVTIRPSR
jgi:hypothetical protein